MKEPFLLLRIDVTKLIDATVKYEPAEPVGENDVLFPIFTASCVVREYVVLRSDEGTIFLDIQGLDV